MNTKDGTLPDNVKDLYSRLSARELREVAPLAADHILKDLASGGFAARISALAIESQESLAGGDERTTMADARSPLRRRDADGRPLPGSMTDRARRCLNMARAHAAQMGHRYLATGHLLAGIAEEGSGIGCSALLDAGLTVAGLVGFVAAAPGALKALTMAEVVYETPALRNALRQAGEVALRLGHNHVGTEHLLISLLSDENSYAARVCELCCVKTHQVVENTLFLCAPEVTVLVHENALWTHPLQIVVSAVATLRAYLDVGGSARVVNAPAEDALRAMTKAVEDFKRSMTEPLPSAEEEGAAQTAADELDAQVGDAKFTMLIDAIYKADLLGKPVAWNGKVITRDNVHLWRQVLKGQFDSLTRAAEAEGWGWEKLRAARSEAESPTSPHDMG